MARRSLSPIDVKSPVIDTRTGVLTPVNQRWFSELSDTVVRIQKTSVDIDVGSVSANSTSEETVTVQGVSSGDVVLVSKPSHSTGLGIVNVRVIEENSIGITYMNTTAAAIDPASETYTVTIIKV